MISSEQKVYSLLKSLQGVDQLKELFWSELHYNCVNQPIISEDWPPSQLKSLAETPVLFASAGTHDDFHCIYVRMEASQLQPALERPMVFHLLKDHPYSLFIFSNDEQSQWHFLNVKYTPHTDQRRLLRRMTVSPRERLHMAAQRIALLAVERMGQQQADLSALFIQQKHDEVFSVEAITGQFFEEYKQQFYQLQTDLQRQTADALWSHDYALQYLNRCMLLYFIQRKLSSGAETDVLHTFWQNDKTSVLYLSNGLFPEHQLEQAYAFTISDERFQQIFAFLERYNFTLTENSSLDQEVSVDPEMIGKVYESLVNVSTDVDDRGNAGIFYTPRTEIDLMCRLALVDNLSNHLGQEHKHRLYEAVFAIETEEKIAADTALANVGLWHLLYHHLRQISVIDPACGSGAFLVGMLSVLDDLQARAAMYTGTKESAYERKKRIIAENLYGVDVMKWAISIAELRLWLALLIDAPVSESTRDEPCEPLLPDFTCELRRGDSIAGDSPFTEIVEGERQGFDIVIGNPPYVRQEHIADPFLPAERATPENKRRYKKQLSQAVYQAFPQFFGYKKTSGRTLNARSDLYIYFYFHGLSLLHAKGSFCFITSNSWLDVDYGAALQEFLLRQCHLKLIMDNQVKRSFSAAGVNTVITLFSAPDDEQGYDSIARFVLFRVPYEHLLSPAIFEAIEAAQERMTTLEYRAYPVRQKDLLEETYEMPEEQSIGTSHSVQGQKLISHMPASPTYKSNKWGGKYLRAPDIYWHIMEKGRGTLKRSGDIAEIKRGLTTGANEFFYLDQTKIAEWGIEKAFLRPVIKSPRECKRIGIEPGNGRFHVFICDEERDALKGTAALKYIEGGEKQGFHQHTTCAARSRWWSLPAETGNSMFVKEANDTSAVFYNPQKYLVDCRLYYANLPAITILYLNSAIGAMLFEIYNRAGLGEGARSLMVSDYTKIPALDEALIETKEIEKILAILYAQSPRKLCSPTESDWATIDTPIFDALKLTQGERDAVYESVITLAEARLTKARSFETEHYAAVPSLAVV